MVYINNSTLSYLESQAGFNFPSAWLALYKYQVEQKQTKKNHNPKQCLNIVCFLKNLSSFILIILFSTVAAKIGYYSAINLENKNQS